jgi:hypothetical protein
MLAGFRESRCHHVGFKNFFKLFPHFPISCILEVTVFVACCFNEQKKCQSMVFFKYLNLLLNIFNRGFVFKGWVLRNETLYMD